MRENIEWLVTIIGIFGSLASILRGDNLLIFVFLAVMIIGLAIASIKYFKNKNLGKNETSLLHSETPGLYAARDLKMDEMNNNIIVSKLIKNVKYSDNNRTSNVTYIIAGEIVGDFCKGLYLTISAGAPIANIKNLGYSLILDEKAMIYTEDFHSIDNSNIEKILPFSNKYKEIESTNMAKKIFFPFYPTPLKKGEIFQAIIYYTWENSIIGLTDSTSYYTSTLFPSGVKKLITHLVFSSRPVEVIVYEIAKDKKRIFSKVPNIKYNDKLFVIRWEIDNPHGTYILQRTLEKWG
jgi:hypothetical protein